MKRWKKLLAGVMAMALILSCVPEYGLEAKASDVSGEFKYDSSGDTVIILKYIGNRSSVEIPSKIDGKNVTCIGGNTFYKYSSLTSVIIPDTVTEIRYCAFDSCNRLTDVAIPNSVTSIEEFAFFDCGFTSITIPSSVTRIGYCAFGYYGNEQKIPNFTIYGTTGSTAEIYANKNGFTFRESPKDNPAEISCQKTVYKAAYGTRSFKINAASKSKMTFTSSAPNVAAVNKNTGKVTIKNTGIAIITIKAGKAAKKVTIKVSPKKPSVKSAKAQKGRKLTVKWTKDKMASGYQVQISTDKKFKKNVKSQQLSKTSYTFTKLTKGKKYYVRLRSYKKSGKELLYSAWGNTKLSDKIQK